jgi:hypothetical protein
LTRGTYFTRVYPDLPVIGPVMVEGNGEGVVDVYRAAPAGCSHGVIFGLLRLDGGTIFEAAPADAAGQGHEGPAAGAA